MPCPTATGGTWKISSGPNWVCVEPLCGSNSAQGAIHTPGAAMFSLNDSCANANGFWRTSSAGDIALGRFSVDWCVPTPQAPCFCRTGVPPRPCPCVLPYSRTPVLPYPYSRTRTRTPVLPYRRTGVPAYVLWRRSTRKCVCTTSTRTCEVSRTTPNLGEPDPVNENQ